MAEIRYSYAHSPTVKRFSESDAFVRGLMGPFGSGKSAGCVIELIKRGAEQVHSPSGVRRARFAVIRNTYPQLNDTTIRTVMDWLPDGPLGFGTYYKAEHRYVIDKLAPDLEIELLFRALDRPEHISNLLSLELTGAWINEAREVPWAIIQGVIGRIGRFPKKLDGGAIRPFLIMDTNPPDDESWWYKQFEEVKPKGWELFKQPGGLADDAENKPNLPPNYYENMLGNGQDFVKVYVHAQYGYVKAGKPIFPEYNDSVHCRDIEYMPGVPIYRGWDFGLTPACVFSQVLPDGTWNTFDELVADSLGINTFSDSVVLHSAQKYPDATFIDIGDPAGEQRGAAAFEKGEAVTCFSILHSKGIAIQAGLQTLTIRLESVRKALTTLVGTAPQMALHSRCKKLRKGYQGRYQYRKIQIAGTEERYHDEPDKNEYSHPHDANQYVAARLFGAALRGLDKPTVSAEPELDLEAGWMG